MAILFALAICTPFAQEVGSGAPWQSWRFVDSANRRPEIRGRVTRLVWNVGDVVSTSPVNDGDLNLFIAPNPADAYVLANRSGRKNHPCGDGTGETGTIEIEIKSVRGPLFSDRFGVGRNVVAKGFWVEDSAHCNVVGSLADKTELHPVEYLIASSEPDPLTARKFSLFLGQDLSDRFDIAGETLIQNLFFDMPTEADVLRPDRAESGGLTDLGVLVERSVLDMWPGARRSEQRVYRRQFPERPQVQFYTKLHAPYMLYMPFYIGDLERTSERLFKDQVSYSVISPRTGPKYVEVTVNAQLISPAGRPGFHTAMWTFETGVPSNPVEQVVTPGLQPKVNMTRRYGPAAGSSQTEWKLAVTSVDRSDVWIPNSVAENFSERRFYHKERTYRIQPSVLEIAIPGQTIAMAPQAASTPQMGRVFCGDKEEFIARESLLPQVRMEPGTFKWRVWLARSIAPGSLDFTDISPIATATIPSPSMFWVTPGNPAKHAEFQAELDPADDHNLQITWTNPSPASNTVLSIGVVGTTDIGETLADDLKVSARCIPRGYDFKSWMEDLLKAEMAMRRFALGGPPKLNPRLDLDILAMPVRRIPQLKGAARLKSDALARYLEGKTLDLRQAKALEELAADGKRLKWAVAPDARELERALANLHAAAFGSRALGRARMRGAIDIR